MNKVASDKLQMARNGKRELVFLLLATCCLLLVSCGFHLRGLGNYQMPEALSTMHVTVAGSQAAHDPLRLTTEEVLRTQGGVSITQATDVPTLVLTGERVDSQVLTVDASGRAGEYMLRYEIGYSLIGAHGEALLLPQTLRLQRGYRFDPLNVLAKEQEEANLRRELRRDALSQIVRRLARYRPAPRDTETPNLDAVPRGTRDAGQP